MIKFDLNPNEQIVLTVRKHWIAIIGHVFALAIGVVVPIILIFVIQIFVPDFPGWMTGNLIYLYTFIYAIWLMIFWAMFFFAWTSYFLDIWVVTTHRIFLVEQKAMFNREVSSLTLDKIQDLIIDIEGVLPTMLKFGTIMVETAGEHKNFKFINARNPEAIKVSINAIQKDFYSRPVPVATVGSAGGTASATSGSTASVPGGPNVAQNSN